MKTWTWLGLAAAAFLLVGLVFGFAPVKSGGYDCGSAFHESGDLFGQQLTDTMEGGTGETNCDEARSTRQPLAWSAIGVGVILGVASIATRSSEVKRDRLDR